MSALAAALVTLSLPLYLFIFYLKDLVPLDIALLLLFCVMTFASAWVTARVMQKPYACYYENHLLMKIAYHTTLDLCDPRQLEFWREQRNFYVYFTMPIKYGEAQWSFVAFFVVCVITVLVIVVRTFTGGLAEWYYFGQILAAAIAALTVTFTYGLMNKAVQIWFAQVKHIELLENTKYNFRQLCLQQGRSEEEENRVLAIIDELIAFIKEHDNPPRVFGLAIKPTLFIVLQGYLITAAGAVLGKLILSPDGSVGLDIYGSD